MKIVIMVDASGHYYLWRRGWATKRTVRAQGSRHRLWRSSCAAGAHGDDARVAVLVWDARAAPRERLCALTMGHARSLSGWDLAGPCCLRAVRRGAGLEVLCDSCLGQKCSPARDL